MTAPTMTTAPPVAPWRQFEVRVARTRRLTPRLTRVTFTGDDLALFADNGFDQRFKLILPVPGRGFADLPGGSDWFAAWRALPADRRNPVRTYTVRAVRPAEREVDVDMVRHGDGGPASRWVTRARAGDPAVLLGPDARYPGDHGGVEFSLGGGPGAGPVQDLLFAGDQTALPAIAAILQALPPGATGTAYLEVPEEADRLDLTAPDGVSVHWVVRDGAAPGDRLVAAVTGWGPTRACSATDEVEEPADDPVAVLWEVPARSGDAPPAGGGAPVRAWVAGEAGAVKAIRRHLVGPCRLPKDRVAFMGYWRLGRAEY